ncbi:MAG: COX15/CtaA family protein [Parvularculaceae bacterium]|nr:COX15/CtaA family protein [Parvularculaceae bacterium]
MTGAIATSTAASRRVALWLFAMCALLCVMVTVGGATRLTDSGLSITEWRPITGAVPPLTEEHWQAELEKYRQIPEYQLVNKGMTLDEFKRIYWWEWGHRFLGRLIGVAFLVPLVVFAIRREISRSLGLKLLGIFALGGMQGALGWYMVQSGLTHRVDVSQYRLAAHLGLAIILLGLMFWTALDLVTPRARGTSRRLFAGALLFAGLVYAQMLLGAFVAGLRAGRVFTTWPLMDGRFFPEGYFSEPARFLDLFDNAAAAQFNHRLGAYAVFAAAIVFAWSVRRSLIAKRARMVLAVVSLQVVLGIWTLVAATPVGLGLLHQFGALIVFLSALHAAHGARTRPSA